VRRNGLTLGVISLGHTGVHWYYASFLLVLPLIAQEFGLTFSQAGLVGSVVMIVGASVNIPSGALSDMLGRRRLQMALALLSPALGFGLVGLAPSYLLVVVCISLVGLGAALWHPPAMSVLSDSFPGRRGLAFSLHEFGANLGDFLGPLATGAILSLLAWRLTLRSYVMLGVVIALLLWFVVPQMVATVQSGRRRGDYWKGLRGLFRNPALVHLSAVSSLRTMGQNALNIFLPLYLAYELKLEPAIMGFYVSMLTFSAMFAGPVMGTLSDKTGRKPPMALGLLTAGALVIMLAVFRSGYPFLGSLLLLGLFLFSIRPIIFAYALDVTPQEMGATTIGFVFTLNQVLAALSPLVAGFLADAVGLLYSFYFVGGLILTSGLLATLLPRAQEAR
jgi:MFS family permease